MPLVRRSALLLLLAATPVLMAQREADPLTRARQAYNEQQFERSISLAREAKQTPQTVDSGALVMARAFLGRFRRSGDPTDIERARESLLSITPARLMATEAAELHIGMAELLFADNQFGAASEMFEVALDRPGMVPDRQRDRVLEWWAASGDRDALLAPDSHRTARYQRMLARMEKELVRRPASPVVAYWMAAAARGADDVDRAWSLAIAAWVQAPMLAGERAAELRADLDALMVDGIIPERAVHEAREADPAALKVALAAEWTAIKAKWGSGGQVGAATAAPYRRNNEAIVAALSANWPA